MRFIPLLAALLLAVAWYAVVILLFYRDRVKRLFSARKEPEPLRREWDEELGEPDGGEMLMGSTREPEGVSSVPMEAFRFAPRAEDPDGNRDIRSGAVPDVLEELKTIFGILEKEGGTKADFISLFALVSAKYPHIKGTPSQQTLNEHIREHLLFPISDEELDQLWE